MRTLQLLLLTAVMTVAGAATAQEVNVYSYRQPFLIEPILEAFTRETGVRVNVVFAKKGLLERLRLEGRNSPADVVLTVDIGSLNDFVEAGLSDGVVTPTLSANIPAQFRHPEGLWYALTVRARVIVASRERVGEGDIARYEDLVDPQWKGRVCTRSGKHVYNVALTAAMIAHHGEDGAQQWLQGLKANLARRPQGNDRAQVKAIHQGECDLALINSYYMGKMLNDPEQVPWAESVRMVFPNQDGAGTHVNVSGMLLTRSAPNRDNAIKLMEFLSGEQAQGLYASVDYEYPVKPGVAWSPLLESWGQFKADPLPLVEIATLRKAAIMLVDRVGFDE